MICLLSPKFSLGMKGPFYRDSLNFFMVRPSSLPEASSPPYGLYKLPGVTVLLTSTPHLRACLCKSSEIHPPLWRKRELRSLVLTLLTLFPCKSRPACALPSDVVTIGSILTLAHIGTVLSIKSSWATFQQPEQGKSKK